MNLKRFRKRSQYGYDKINKMNNFTFLNNNYCEKGQVVLAGDSITEMFNMELFEEFSTSSGKKVYNRGISGDTSDRLLERFEDNVLVVKPSAIVLLIGTNDLTIKADVDYVFDNIKKIISMTKGKCPDTKIILQPVYPVEYKQKAKNAKIIELNAKLELFAVNEGIEFVDVYPLLLDDMNGFDKRYTFDGLHPNVHGFEIVARELVKKLG